MRKKLHRMSLIRLLHSGVPKMRKTKKKKQEEASVLVGLAG